MKQSSVMPSRVPFLALVFSLVLLPFCSAQAQMATPGSFGVGSDGSASYEIPIKVPPGTGGLEPKLSFHFNSQADNGLLGVGWGLSGLSSITRCPKTPAQDGSRGAVNYDSNDRFCLDGQRLMVVSGTYGANNAEYRTETDGFTKIISYISSGSTPTSFKAWTKSGLIMEFGNTSDSRIEALGTSIPRAWGVNKVSDTKGNYYTVTYTEDGTDGGYYPSQIDYTGNSNTSLATHEYVQFTYSTTRTDATDLYHAGSRLKNTARLTHVKTYVKGSPTDTAVLDYQLAYEYGTSSGRSRITSITECSGDGSLCQPATAFSWSDVATNSFTPYSSALGADYGAPVTYIPIQGDFNGDGRSDFAFAQADMIYVFLSNGDGSFTAVSHNLGANYGAPITYIPIIGDFNGDGLTDFAFAQADMIYVFISNGDSSFTATSHNLGANYGAPITYIPIVGDFDGDGRTDFAFAQADMIYVFMSNGDTSFTATSHNLGANYGAPITYMPIVGDFNGDGRTDFAFAQSTMLYVFLSNGDTTFTASSQGLGADYGAPITYGLVGGDFNGDGKTDFAFLQSHMIYSFISKGDGTFTPNSQDLINDYGAPLTFRIIGGDFNNDGKSDFALAEADSLYILISKGDGTFTTGYQTLNADFGSPISYVVLSGDFNGDGKSDFAFAQSTMVYSEYGAGDLPDMLTSIVTGVGATTSITYTSLANGSIYTKDSGSTYPVSDIQAPLYMVSAVSTSNGIGGTSQSTYTYTGLKFDVNGRGLLGFRQMKSTDTASGINVLTTMSQSFPFIGLATETKKSTSGSTVLNKVVNTLTCNDFNSGCTLAAGRHYFPYISQTVQSSHDLNGATLPSVTTSYTYDSYGNPTEIVTATSNGGSPDTADGYSQTTDNTYTNDTTNWFLGRLTGAQVTAVKP